MPAPLILGKDVFLHSVQPEINDIYLLSKQRLEDRYNRNYSSNYTGDDHILGEEEHIFDRFVKYVSVIVECIHEKTKMNLEEFHKEWIEMLIANALYCIVPSDDEKRRNIANKFNIELINRWAFAYWARRTGKSYNTMNPVACFLFCMPGGTAALQSVHKNSAAQTMGPVSEHILSLFAYLKIPKEFDPIVNAPNEKGMKFVNWYGAQLLLTGKYTSVKHLPPHCYSSIIIISGNNNAARGITVHMYICDEERFVREHAKINLMMGIKRKGTIFIAMSSQDPEDHNLTQDNLMALDDLVSVSVYAKRCKPCQDAGIDECPHDQNPGWISNDDSFGKVMSAVVREDNRNILNVEQNNYSISIAENVFVVPEKPTLLDWKVSSIPIVDFLIVSIDPAVNGGNGSAFATSISAATRRDNARPGAVSFIVSAFFLFERKLSPRDVQFGRKLVPQLVEVVVRHHQIGDVVRLRLWDPVHDQHQRDHPDVRRRCSKALVEKPVQRSGEHVANHCGIGVEWMGFEIVIFDYFTQNLRFMGDMCKNVLKFVLDFRKKHVELRNHMMMFVCENNQGGLPAEMYRVLRECRPLLCNWMVYAKETKDEFGGINLGNMEKNKTSILLNHLLNNNAPQATLRFYHTIEDEKVGYFINECRNEQREINPGEKTPIRLFPKAGHRNDVLATMYNAMSAFYTFNTKKKINELTIKLSVCHRNCPNAALGHAVM